MIALIIGVPALGCHALRIITCIHLCSPGWRDEGDHFRLRTSGALMPDAVSLFEVEQLLVAPERWPEQAMRLFGAAGEIKVGMLVVEEFQECIAEIVGGWEISCL